MSSVLVFSAGIRVSAEPISPEKISKFARENHSKYVPNPDSRCSEFVRDYAGSTNTFSVNDFANKTANQIIEFLRGTSAVPPKIPNGWNALYDEAHSKTNIQEAFLKAQRSANSGHLVIVGWKDTANTDPHGHVAFVVPGQTEESGDWKNIAKDLPQIAQAGRQTTAEEIRKGIPKNFYTFAQKKLSYGFTPGMKGVNFVIYMMN